jgi:hypothetical protein
MSLQCLKKRIDFFEQRSLDQIIFLFHPIWNNDEIQEICFVSTILGAFFILLHVLYTISILLQKELFSY